MKHFYFLRLDNAERGHNQRIKVLEVDPKTKDMKFVGEQQFNTAAHYGDKAVAAQIISEVKGFKMKDSYTLVRKDVIIHEIGTY